MQEYENTEKEMKETAQEPEKEEKIVNGFQKMEDSIVSGFNRVSDKCVEKMFSREGETVEETKERLANAEKKRTGRMD